MIFNIDDTVAVQYGINEAILIDKLVQWIQKAKATKTGEHEGRTWVAGSMRAFSKLFPFWTQRQMNIVIKSLMDQQVILSEVIVGDGFNTTAYDRTQWYALVDERKWLPKKFFENDAILPKRQMDVTKTSNGTYESVTYPENTTKTSEAFNESGESISPNGEIHFTKTSNGIALKILKDFKEGDTKTQKEGEPKDEFFALALEDEKPNQEQTRPEPDETPPLDNPAPDNDLVPLVSLFYQRAIEYGWRKSAPHSKDQVADVGILQKYRDDEYTYSAIRTMIEWHAARHKETGDPIRSFAFFDPDRYPHKTPMQVALETSWAKVEAEKKAEREAPVIGALSQDEGMALFRAALAAIAPKPFPDAKPDNRRKLQEQSDELAERRRKKWLLSLDPGDTSIPDVSELRRPQESEWMDREIQEAAT